MARDPADPHRLGQQSVIQIDFDRHSPNSTNDHDAGLTHVALPANAEAFRKQAKPGSVYVEFDVPADLVKPTSVGLAKIPGPKSLDARLAAQKGAPTPQMSPATNIERVEKKGAKD